MVGPDNKTPGQDAAINAAQQTTPTYDFPIRPERELTTEGLVARFSQMPASLEHSGILQTDEAQTYALNYQTVSGTYYSVLGIEIRDEKFIRKYGRRIIYESSGAYREAFLMHGVNSDSYSVIGIDSASGNNNSDNEPIESSIYVLGNEIGEKPRKPSILKFKTHGSISKANAIHALENLGNPDIVQESAITDEDRKIIRETWGYLRKHLHKDTLHRKHHQGLIGKKPTKPSRERIKGHKVVRPKENR